MLPKLDGVYIWEATSVMLVWHEQKWGVWEKRCFWRGVLIRQKRTAEKMKLVTRASLKGHFVVFSKCNCVEKTSMFRQDSFNPSVRLFLVKKKQIRFDLMKIACSSQAFSSHSPDQVFTRVSCSKSYNSLQTWSERQPIVLPMFGLHTKSRGHFINKQSLSRLKVALKNVLLSQVSNTL